MKIISFSLWGDKPLYNVGAIENIKLAKEYCPDWKCRFYVDNTVYTDTLNKIENNGAEVVVVQKPLGGNADFEKPYRGMFWRFLPADDKDVEAFVSRDCDSRISPRELSAVGEWMDSDKCFHTMHDHRYHMCVPILGGMWGAKRGCIDGMADKIIAWNDFSKKGVDQDFLGKIIWPLVKDKSINHSSLPNKWAVSSPFPAHKKTFVEYVGQAFNDNGESFIP